MTDHTAFTTDRRGWHLDKGVSISTLLTMGAYTLAIIVWATTVEKHVSMNSYVNDRQDETIKEAVKEIKLQNEKYLENMERIYQKLDEINRNNRTRQ